MLKKSALIGAPIVGLLVFYLLQSLCAVKAAAMAGIMVAVVVLWLIEVLPAYVPPLLGLIFALFFKIDSPSSILSNFYHPAVLLLLGSFVLARALEKHRLSYLLTGFMMKKAGHTPFRFVFVITLVTFVFSMWISNSAATAMMIPLMVSGLKNMHSEDHRLESYKAKAVLFVAFAASIGGIATPIGSPTNLIGLEMMSQLGLQRPDFFSWMVLGLSVAGSCYLCLMLYLKFLYRGIKVTFSPLGVSDGVMPGSSLQVKIVALWLVFGGTVLLWVLPGLSMLLFGDKIDFIKQLNDLFSESRVALLSALFILFVPFDYRQKQKTIMSFDELRFIDWGTLVLFGASIALGGLLMKSGLINALAQWISQWHFLDSEMIILFFCLALAVFLSDLMSNTATVNVIVPLAYAIAQAKGISPQIPVLGAILASSYGFLLPVSTPPNAMAYATGLIGLRQMMRYGILMDILGIVVIGCVLILSRG